MSHTKLQFICCGLRESTDGELMLLETRVLPGMAAFFEGCVAVCEDKISFLSNKQVIFITTSKFCVKPASQSFNESE